MVFRFSASFFPCSTPYLYKNGGTHRRYADLFFSVFFSEGGGSDSVVFNPHHRVPSQNLFRHNT